jgi:hypothetical protein
MAFVVDKQAMSWLTKNNMGNQTRPATHPKMHPVAIMGSFPEGKVVKA